MGQIFNMDNFFWQFMGKLVDVFVLNVLWFICCIPIITIGPATTAVYYVTLKLVRDEESHIVSSFFKSFKENLKQGIIIGVIMTLLGAFFIYDIWAYPHITGIGKYVSIIFIVIFAVYFCVLTYVFPLLAKFENTVRQTFKNAFLISMRHILKSIMMIAICVVVWGIGLTYFPPIIIWGFGLIAFLQSYFLVGIFDKYIPKEETVSEVEENMFMSNKELTDEIEEQEEEKAETENQEQE